MLSKIKIKKPKDAFVLAIGILCTLYVINPTAGIFELLPDNIPLVGNLDEGAAVTGILMALRYFGYDFTNFFTNKNQDNNDSNKDQWHFPK